MAGNVGWSPARPSARLPKRQATSRAGRPGPVTGRGPRRSPGVALVPGEWFADDGPDVYIDYLARRLGFDVSKMCLAFIGYEGSDPGK